MSAHAVAALRARFGTEVPPVLWTPPDPRRTVDSDEPALGRPAQAEQDDGLDDDELAALGVLAAPQVRIEGRSSDALGSRLCLARSGLSTARVIRSAGTATVDLPHCDGSADRLGVLVAPLLGAGVPADPAVAACLPAAAGMEALSAGEASAVAAGLRAIGVAADPARLIAKVFTRSRRSVEFTVHAGESRCAGVVAVIDAPSGRVVVRTAGGSGAGAFMAVAEGSTHRIGRALRSACEELPGGGWTP
ncbi:ESX secretion-associated protein EspG [Tsukamurella pseudospumae]|uniref:ESX secretion-associated protein EspG n=1 Tax=Tsukamurella pseudospumae TaxID=239498 RepID=A0A138A402_9ACTN|nr:ESX secretion-associated protein EspG [Tsukamurella pseudospumae]KXO96316.1 hypothetical protein AXK61_22635 [Tsukamurella pseudospumae]KXP05167.1 hypothetical protein AXK60_13520 [Tsukamurella pseudospumae]